MSRSALGQSIEVRRPKTDSAQLARKLDVPEFMAVVLGNRGIESSEQLLLTRDKLLEPSGIRNLEEAASRIVQAILGQQKITIAADFDTDGATSAALCVSFLEAVGARDVQFRVPNRQTMGYGLTEKFVSTLLEDDLALIITVDNGMSSAAGVALARSHGVDVIITDHHLAPDELPDANSIVNPNIPGNSFNSQPAGVGVAFYLMTAVRKILGASDYFEQNEITRPNLTEWLDLVAVGTVADMVPLDGNNRTLVKMGLDRIKQGRARPGIQALIELDLKPAAMYVAEDIGFKIAPKLNAAGRLTDMTVGIQLLLCKDRKSASAFASQLDEINKIRRDMQREMVEGAALMVPEVSSIKSSICVFNPKFHEGLVGLVASNLVEKYHRPAIAFASSIDSENGYIKGSARSIAGINIRDVLSDLNTRYPHLIHQFGGHAMAAGLTIKRENHTRFSTLFENAVSGETDENTFLLKVWSDGDLDSEDISLDTVSLIDRFGPWGTGFPFPIFHGTFDVLEERVFRNNVVRLTVAKDNNVFDAVAFNSQPLDASRVRFTYRPQSNFYQGSTTLQLVIEHVVEINP